MNDHNTVLCYTTVVIYFILFGCFLRLLENSIIPANLFEWSSVTSAVWHHILYANTTVSTCELCTQWEAAITYACVYILWSIRDNTNGSYHWHWLWRQQNAFIFYEAQDTPLPADIILTWVMEKTECWILAITGATTSNPFYGLFKSTWISQYQTKWKSTQRSCKHCTLAVVRRSQNFLPRHRPLPGGMRWTKFNQLETVTTFTYKTSLVRIDERNFELSW